MENELNSLEAAIRAAGMATAYVADDWTDEIPGGLVPLVAPSAH